MSKPLTENERHQLRWCVPESHAESMAIKAALARLDFLERKLAAADQVVTMVHEFIDADGSVAETWMRQAISIYDKVTE
jgi:hypothetical protein